MKLLFDANISPRVVRKLSDFWPNLHSVFDFSLEYETDHEIHAFAQRESMNIATQDSDFVAIANLYGVPPQIIYIQAGNMQNKKMVEFLSQRRIEIETFLAAVDFSVLTLS